MMLASIFGNCSSPPSRDECYYERADTYAEIIDISPHPEGGGKLAVTMDFKASKLALADQDLGELRGVTIDQDYVDRNKLKVGNRYEVVVSEITKGECTPLFVTFNHNLE